MFGWGAESAGVVFLDRDNRKSAFESYKLAAKAVQEGRRIVVFPESTRGSTITCGCSRRGRSSWRSALEEPVIPTVIYGAREVMGKGSFRVKSGTVARAFPDAHSRPRERPTTTGTRSWKRRAREMGEFWKGVWSEESRACWRSTRFRSFRVPLR